MTPARHRLRARAGFSLIELLIAMIVGLVILGSATGFAVATSRNLTSNEGREDYARKGRFLGMAFRRDFGEAGVDLESQVGFGSVATFNDTASALAVWYANNNRVPTYQVVWRAADPNFTTAGRGTCPTFNNTVPCVHIRKDPVEGHPAGLAVGDAAILQVNGVRRLVIITQVTQGSAADSAEVRFLNVATLLRRASWATPVVIQRTGTTLTKVRMVAFWRNPATNELMRAERFNTNGTLNGFVFATNVQTFDAGVTFTDGTDADSVNTAVAGRQYDDLNGVWVRALVGADRADPRVNGGQPLSRTYEWRVVPRNLIFERNR